jgi:regulator of protease activity HflC (stomatin/prohibitin superfamily)
MKKFQIPNSGLVSLIGSIIAILLFGWTALEYGYNRIYVPEGYSLQLRYKGPPLPFLPGGRPASKKGEFASVDAKNPEAWPKELGILEQLRGPGRYFYCPLWWERNLVPDVTVEPGTVAIGISKMGDRLSEGQFLVDGQLGKTKYKGILRKAFAPGRYRVNPYAYVLEISDSPALKFGTQSRKSGWVEIPTGYVGVVTNLAGNEKTGAKAGIQENVLPPGIYPINPKEQHVDIVEIGFREKSITADLRRDPQGDLMLDEAGEPLIADEESGITFPSNDGFRIQMDFTAIWGIMPDQAANVIRKFGNVEAVEQKVVSPQIESICRNMGSTLKAVELLEGESRAKFQEDTRLAFESVLKDKDVTLQVGLVRHIYIPQEVRVPIQDSYISKELKLTREQEQLTTKTEADLGEAEEKVKLESERVVVETEKMVAQAVAEGAKTAEETKAEATKLVAVIDKETALLEAQATVLLGEANSGAKKLLEEAKAQKFKLAVEAFGSGKSYNEWVFATNLPDDIQLNLLYAGEGTFWTDLKSFTDAMLGKKAISGERPTPRSR